MVKQKFFIEKIDKNGYPRGKLNHSDLIHRQVAYNEIYLKDREKYTLPFSKYIIHHKDGDKNNFNSTNLQLVTKEEHEEIHGFLKNKKLFPKDEEKKSVKLITSIEEINEILERKKKIPKNKSPKDISLISEESKKRKKWFFINLFRKKRKLK